MVPKLKTSAQRIQDILHELGLTVQVLEFSESTRTSQEAANAAGCELGQIAKTLIFKGKTSGRPICIIASGKNRVDEKKIAQLIGEKVEKADADFVLQHTGFAIGGIPAVGYTLELTPLVDSDLIEYEEVWSAAGTPNAIFKLTLKDLLRITRGELADIRK